MNTDRSLGVLVSLQDPQTGLLGAAFDDDYFEKSWWRDNFFMKFGFLAKGWFNEVRSLAHGSFNFLLRYDDKIQRRIVEGHPGEGLEFRVVHPRVWKRTLDEIWNGHGPWGGYLQSDAVADLSATLAISHLLVPGGVIRSHEDWLRLQQLGRYQKRMGLFPDQGFWENGDPTDLRLSSLAPQIGTLALRRRLGMAVSENYRQALLYHFRRLFPGEMIGRHYDLAKFSVIFPWAKFLIEEGAVTHQQLWQMLHELCVDAWSRQWIRYHRDYYHHRNGIAPRWYSFGFGIAGLSYLMLGDTATAWEYLHLLEGTVTTDGLFCESISDDGASWHHPGLGMAHAFHLTLRTLLEGGGGLLREFLL